MKRPFPTTMSAGTSAILPALWLLGAACAAPAPVPAPTLAAPPVVADLALPAERHLAHLRALTAGGENAEAYWAWGGDQLVMQARPADASCDRIFRLSLAPQGGAPGAPAAPPIPVSDGRGATTCSYFLPGDREVIFASTEGGGPACPPRPDHSQGYVWALYPSYDIYRAQADGSGVRRLTTTDGYDAEGTVCGKDGSIVFTSVRDGDIDLYRMDADGGQVRRLTHTVGYDGGAFFDADCSHIVWRASRPKPGPELDDYRRLLGQNLVRPSKLELYVANADGSEPMQITYLDAASFGPAWMPGDRRVIFASNFGDPRGREFDLWAIDVAGTRLERITAAPGFDGFPLFSPDRKRLAFSSNRITPPGAHDTNVFLADWTDAPVQPTVELAADRVLADISWLADPTREGRGVGTAGLDAAGAYIEARFRALGLEPAGDDGGYRQSFPVRTGISVDPATSLRLGGVAVAREAFQPAGFSASGKVAGKLVLAGYGVRDQASHIDDYAKRDVKDQIVVVRRFVPDHPAFSTPDQQRRAGDLRQKAWLAREHGARALLIVDSPPRPAGAPADWQPPEEAALPAPRPEGHGDAGIPVLLVKRAALAPVLAELERGKTVTAALEVALGFTTQPAFNVLARLRAHGAARAPGVVIVGAHYDHLGLGDHHSLAPGSHLPHLGADDNASGAATVLEVARALAVRADTLARDVVFIGFSGEEEGVLGSTHFTRAPPPGLALSEVRAMINLDMVGRLRDNRATILGASSATEWPALIAEACAEARIECAPSPTGGFGPSDQMPFYAAGVPVAHFFTGSHADYHKPSDSADRINAAGAAQIGVAVAALATRVAARDTPLSMQRLSAPAPEGDARSFNASLGTIPDYAGPPAGQTGVLLAGVRPGGAAEKAGLQRGDLLVRLGNHPIGSVEDLMYALNASKPGETVTAVLKREGRELRIAVTFQEGHR
jgi:Peptidase family M28/PDZ domain/PA domain/WD40-like Beta Propeller Repeat